MAQQVSAMQFTGELLVVLEEAFENVQGIFLDRGTSLFETLAEISAAQASVPVGGRCATLAAQVAHINFYLEVLERVIRSGQPERVDWDEIWHSVSAVNEDEWQEIQARLKATYRRVHELIGGYEHWETPRSMGGAIGLVAHSAYHLGEIRQALCTLRA